MRKSICVCKAVEPMTPFNQENADCRCEWGVTGHDALARADVTIVVDVLSFSTCIDVAVGREAVILPFPWNNSTASEFAAAQHAELAGRRGESRYSLSPACFLDAPAGLRCVLPSPNGAMLSLRAAETGAIVLAGCLRNAQAAAEAARRLGSTFNICPAGERWPDGSLRASIEDWLGAGAILRFLPGSKSPEAAAAIAAFESAQNNLLQILSASGSGRELTGIGFAQDVELAAQFNVSQHVPQLLQKSFVAIR
jgi:2-phosphosulfolactate phosphatase